jgi:5-methylcytosine-specific restriction endonuclease McrA
MMTGIPRPSRNCTHPGCHTAVTSGARCIEHARAPWTGSRTANDPVAHRKRYGGVYRKRREFVLYRDSYCCVVCSRPRQLQVHHLDESGRVEALVTLCVSCHRSAEAENRHGSGPTLTAIADHMRAAHGATEAGFS